MGKKIAIIRSLAINQLKMFKKTNYNHNHKPMVLKNPVLLLWFMVVYHHNAVNNRHVNSTKKYHHILWPLMR